ncbi:MAG: metal-dependent hydrolase [Anaerolineales bacterium]|nr:metal-dependent hydrolase [Anaerolineales bacterium]
MSQNGIHALVGVAARKWAPQKEWLLIGVVLGSMAPDLDNLAVAYVTLTKGDAHALHRTFTHSFFTILAVLAAFYLIAMLTKNQKWNNLGIGLGIGILLHILLDLALWFNGVELLWPLGGELNFWAGFTPPAWLSVILDTGEFLAFGLYFLLLISLSRKHNTDSERQGSVKNLAYVEFALFVIFATLFLAKGSTGLPYTIYGALYLISLITALVITVKMKKTIELV